MADRPQARLLPMSVAPSSSFVCGVGLPVSRDSSTLCRAVNRAANCRRDRLATNGGDTRLARSGDRRAEGRRRLLDVNRLSSTALCEVLTPKRVVHLRCLLVLGRR